MRTLFCSDLHGHIREFEALLGYSNYVAGKDILIIGGDMIDRGPNSGRVLKRVMQEQRAHPDTVFVVRGNHEQMMIECFKGINNRWMFFGGPKTLDSFDEEFSSSESAEMVEWVSSLPLVYETQSHIFVHAGLNMKRKITGQDPTVTEMCRGRLYSYAPEQLLAYTNERILVHGHTPVNDITSDGARINCDLGISTNHVANPRLALVDITNQIYYACAQGTDHIETQSILWTAMTEHTKGLVC